MICGEELANLQQFTANFADEPDIVIPRPYADLCGPDMLTMSLVTGQKVTVRDSVTRHRLGRRRLVRRASKRVPGDGVPGRYLHADPHPGNSCSPIGQHLAILDFGDVGRLTGRRQGPVEALLLAVGSRDVEELTDIVIDLTHAPADLDVDRLNGQIGTWLNRYLGGNVAISTWSVRPMQACRSCTATGCRSPATSRCCFRVLVRLQGLGGALGAKVSLTELLQPYLRKMAAERLDPRVVGRQAVRNLRSWQRVLADTPRTIRPLLQQPKEGTVHVELEIHDADGVADRLTDGLLGSASLLASAQLLSRGTGPRIGPVSAPGAVALAVGVLTWRDSSEVARLARAHEPCSGADPAGPQVTRPWALRCPPPIVNGAHLLGRPLFPVLRRGGTGRRYLGERGGEQHSRSCRAFVRLIL